ncbi:hypothetical protein WJX72_006207 [[Myrmecia] bisecta]|uniref:Prolyl endopeptidase n=1 Tax=[Myrmecia] bisecta TaxID=41462 RepID=A0AAW1R6Z3_9CHLO
MGFGLPSHCSPCLVYLWKIFQFPGPQRLQCPDKSRWKSKLLSPRKIAAVKRPVQRHVYGVEWTDEYSWVEAGGPEVERLLQQENQQYQTYMQRLQPLQRQLQAEMMRRLPDHVETRPERIGAYEYFTRQTEQQPMVCFMRRDVTASGSPAEEVVLDVNKLVEQHGYANVGQVKISQDHRRLAFTLDVDAGRENYSAVIQDIATGQVLDKIPSARSVEWAADNSTLVYTVVNEMGRPYKVMQHGLGAPASSDMCLVEEAEEGCFVEIGRTKDWRFITINRNSKLACEVHILDAVRPSSAPICIQPRRQGLEYFVEHQGGFLYILTNAGGNKNYAVMVAPVQTPGLRHWRVLVPERPDFAIQDMDMFAGRCVLYERYHGRPTISVLSLGCGRSHALSHDGTQVPMTVAHARGLPLDGSPPLLLSVYGAYGHNVEEAAHCQFAASLLDRGWVVAWAHVRGGGERGRRWHEAGRQANKMNSVLDLEACMDALVRTGYTKDGQIALQGESAGGLLVGALLNRRPGSMGAVIARVPFVDLLTTMCNPELPLTMHEYDEWGDPNHPHALQLMHQLCPYQNVRPARYPPLLVTCSQNDTRVPSWGPTKWALRVRDCQQGPHPVLLSYQTDAGHFGHEQELVYDTAQQFAFLIDALQNGAWIVK